jgi:hypothetical protein
MFVVFIVFCVCSVLQLDDPSPFIEAAPEHRTGDDVTHGIWNSDHTFISYFLSAVQSRQKCINSSQKITERARPRLLHHKSQQPR